MINLGRHAVALCEHRLGERKYLREVVFLTTDRDATEEACCRKRLGRERRASNGGGTGDSVGVGANAATMSSLAQRAVRLQDSLEQLDAAFWSDVTVNIVRSFDVTQLLGEVVAQDVPLLLRPADQPFKMRACAASDALEGRAHSVDHEASGKWQRLQGSGELCNFVSE